MSSHRQSGPTRALLAVLLAAAVGGSSCGEFVGVEPPSDALHFPTGIAIHPSGRYLYVVNSNFDVRFSQERGGTVTVIDTDTLEIIPESTVRIGSFGGRAVLSADARRLYVAVRGDDSVVRLDVSEDGRMLTCRGRRDGLPCRLTNLAGDPFDLAVERVSADLEVGGVTDIEMIVVTHLQSNDITAISLRDDDPATEVRASSEVTAGGSALAVHPRTGNYYAVGRFDDRVRVFLPLIGREGDVAGVFSLGNVPLTNPIGNYDARDIAFGQGGDRAYVAVRNPHALLVIDTSPANRETGGGSRDTFLAQIDLDEPPETLAVVAEPQGEFVYAMEFGADSVTVVDPRDRLVVDRFRVGDGPTGVAVDTERHQRLYVTLFREDAVGVVDIDPDSRRYRTTVAKIK